MDSIYLMRLFPHRSKTSGSGAPAPPLDSVNIEELVTKGLRRINVLIEKTVDLKSSSDLEKRMEDINVSETKNLASGQNHVANVWQWRKIKAKLPVQNYN